MSHIVYCILCSLVVPLRIAICFILRIVVDWFVYMSVIECNDRRMNKVAKL